MRAELRLLEGLAATTSTLTAGARVDRAIHAYWRAHDAFVAAPLGNTERLLELAELRKAAVTEVGMARLALRSEVARREGRRIFKVVANV